MKFFTAGDVLDHADASSPKHPVTVHVEDSIADALGVMFEHEFSQLPVTANDRIVGVVTHESICQLLKITSQPSVQQRSLTAVMTAPNFVAHDRDIFELFETFAIDEYVLIGDETNLEGIITQFDVFHFLKRQVEPFLKIGEIERSLRSIFQTAIPDLDNCIEATFADRAEYDPTYTPPTDVSEFDFSEYHTFIAKNIETLPPRFETDRGLVLELVDAVREIRNALFHFRTSVDEIDRELLAVAHSYFTSIANDTG